MSNENVPTYDDIEPYTRVVIDGYNGWIIDKGEHIVESVEDGGHIYVEFVEEAGHDSGSRRMHENLVNHHLENREHLWVDFGNRLNGVNITATDGTN